MTTLTKVEKDYVEKVLFELKKYKINKEQLDSIREQLLDHISTSHENGETSIEQLGDSEALVKDYLEIYGIDMNHTGTHKSNRISIILGAISFPVVYLISQLILSLFLTQSFSQEKSFDYNIMYRISEQPWWNILLVSISLFSALVISFFLSVILRRRLTRFIWLLRYYSHSCGQPHIFQLRILYLQSYIRILRTILKINASQELLFQL
ncbi:hypothetical protein V7112_16460 [Bacillus sp. JJ1566]|uniref:hypothetical protein n=1 Tax=Bacillus sp. JJ1566 TaxID=3122961 RepID=UPI0030006E6A